MLAKTIASKIELTSIIVYPDLTKLFQVLENTEGLCQGFLPDMPQGTKEFLEYIIREAIANYKKTRTAIAMCTINDMNHSPVINLITQYIEYHCEPGIDGFSVDRYFEIPANTWYFLAQHNKNGSCPDKRRRISSKGV